MGKNPYRADSDVITFVIEDCTGRRISKYRASISDEESISKIFKSIIQKYGLDFIVVKSSEYKLRWLKSDEEFKW